MMKCETCTSLLEEGYLFSSKDGALSYGLKVPGVFENAKDTEGFIKVTSSVLGRRSAIKAYYCRTCHKFIIYQENIYE